MRLQVQYHWRWFVFLLAVLVAVTGCSEPNSPTAVTPPPEPINTDSPTDTPLPDEPTPPPPTSTTAPTIAAEPESNQPEQPATPVPELVIETDPLPIDVRYQDLFKDTTSGWPSGIEFDNYYIGYHEPEYYHVEVHEPNDNAIVPLPGLEFSDITAEVEVFADEANTSPSGDFRFGLVLRRSGNQYYAFTISPITKKWSVFKSSPTGLVTLEEGTDETIHNIGETDKLRVDANGPILTFHINGRPVSQLEDRDYTSGDIGFIVETADSPRAHIHYDSLTVREVSEIDVQYQDLFRDTTSGWPSGIEFDNYYIGYHEPEYYHVEVHEPNDNAIVALPGLEFSDITAEVEVFADEANTSPSGDFRFGLVLRRSGNQYYAFTISPITKKWSVFKSSPTGLVTLEEGTDETIHNIGETDKLRVDANGPILTFHINGRPVSQLEDRDYTTGALGFIVETADSPRAHIHYDSLTVREPRAPQANCTVTVLLLNLRGGPGLSYAPIGRLPNGTLLEPLARSGDGLWIQVRAAGEEQIGWVTAYSPYVTCNFPVNDLPLP